MQSIFKLGNHHVRKHNMDYKDLTAILLKTTGAVLIFWYLSWLPSLIPLATKQPFSGLLLLVEALPTIVGLMFAGLLFTFPATVSNKLISGVKLSHDETFVVSLQIIALRLIGIYHVITSIVDLIHHISTAILAPTLYENMGVTPPLSGWTPDLVGWTIASFAELAIALWLAIGAEGILRLIQKLRGRNF
jgi:hypothetical protein